MSDASARARDLIQLTERLTGLVEKEILLIAERKPQELSRLDDERTRLAALYAREMTGIRREKGALSGASPDLRMALTTATERFRSALDKHRLAVERVRRVTEGIVKAIADDIAARTQPPVGYGSSASTRRMQPLAFNGRA